MKDLSVSLCGVALDNPLIPCSGTFGYGWELADVFDLNSLGALVLKGTTVHPRFGNPQPRIAETTAGMLNAVGLQNPGMDAVCAEELPKLRQVYHKPVIANVSGFSVAEYAACCEKLAAEEQISLIEVNISCPNVHGGGISFGTSPQLAAEVTRAVRAVTKKPIFMKLTPNVTDIASIARACEDAGADGISLINTLLGMRLDLRRRRPLLANVTGGLSGPAVFPVALRMVWQVYEAVSIPIMGMGGVSGAKDVIEMMLAGATAVQIGAASLADPHIFTKILADLPDTMERLRIDTLSELIGAAHRA